METPSSSNTTLNQSPTSETIATENTMKLSPTAPAETQTPMEIQSQANIANNEYENGAFTMLTTTPGMKTVLVVGVLGQVLLL